MAYKFKAGESVPESIRRIATEELDSAAEQLDGKGSSSREEAIHEARKSVKKTRAILRLAKSELGDVRSRENVRLRDAGRRLSELRDAGAIVVSFDDLKAAFPNEAGLDALEPIRAGLVARRDQTMEQPGIEERLKAMAKSFRSAAKRVKAWPLNADSFAAIRTGLEDSYREGRRAMTKARKQPTAPNYHEWRKRAKDHWYHIRLLEPLWTDVMQAHEKSLKDLETWLGDDHNLVVLREKILSEPDLSADEKAASLATRLIERRQKELRKNSLALGARIYEEKPREFSRRMKRLWEAWQASPKSLEQAEEHTEAAPPKKAAGSRGSRQHKTRVTAA
ncbi:MAG TPA: CHAD domain-containing protein [Bryobacteraceae bacterium]|nr:CHAD domain-containing protein [Bryobacteraceae bacterium]